MKSTIEAIRSTNSIINIKVFANGLYAIVDKAFTNPDDLKDLNTLVDFDINGFTTATLDIDNLISTNDSSAISDQILNELFINFIKNHRINVGLETADDNTDRIESGGFYKLYTNFDSEKLFELGVIASGMCFELDPIEMHQTIVTSDYGFIGKELSDEPYTDQMRLHPRFPCFVVPTETFRVDKNTYTEIKCIFFNYYGEFIKIGYLAGDNFNIHLSADDNILSKGFSQSYHCKVK